MSTTNKTYLDYAGLQTYNTAIKNWANSENQVAYKTVLKSSDGNYLYFYKKANAVLGTDNPDVTISLGGGDSSEKFTALATALGAAWSGNTLTLNDFATGISATDIVGAINEVWTDTNTFIGEIPSGATADTVIGYAAEVAAAEADAAEIAANGYTDTAIAALDADLDASGTAAHSGTFVVSGVTEVDGVITSVDSVEVEAAGAAAALAATLADVATSGDAEDVTYDNTISGLRAADVQAAIDEVNGNVNALIGDLGTAAYEDIATSAIAEGSTDDSLVSAAQVATFVASEIAGLEGAMHFVGVITRQTGETDAQAIARVVTNPESGDVVVMSDNAKEYIYDGTAWREVGDEGLYVQKSTTIAGVDLQDDITQSELQTALGLGSAAYENTSAFDAAGTAAGLIAGLDATESQTAGADGLALSVTEVDGVITSISGSIAANTYDTYGTAADLIADLDTDSDVSIATYTAGTSGAADVITLQGSVAEANGIIGAGSADTITLSTITATEINALFA